MAKNKIVLCDSNIIIDIINGVAPINNILANLDETIAISIITEIEIIIGALNKEMQQNLIKKLKYYNVVQIDEKISVLACDLIKNYRLSNGLDIPDAFIAATSIVYEIPLYTNNIKDFKFIKGIELFNQSSH